MRAYRILTKYVELHLQDVIFKILSNEGLRKRFGEEGGRLVG